MRSRAAIVTVAGAIALRLAIGVGFVNYDTLYSLVWGQQLARGQTPTYQLTLAPTPHPLLELLGLILAPFGFAATLSVVVAIAYLALAWLGYLVYRLGSEWFSKPAGLAAAALILSRYEVLSYGVRSYADIPYVALVLAALLIETRRRRAGRPVLAVLALAGLLRPEAWLFALLYWAWLWRGTAPRERAVLAALVAAAPVLWGLSDLLITGNALWSLSHTQTTAMQLKRTTGLVNVPYTGARRLGEVLAPDGLLAGGLGLVLALWLARRRAALGAIAGAIAVAALALVASSGLPIQDRYVFLIAALAAVFGGAGLFGWQTLSPGDPQRRLWQAAAAVIVVGIVVTSVAWQAPRFHKTFDSSKPKDKSLSAQQQIASDLTALVKDHHISTACGAISLPYATAVPLLALELHTSPADIVFRQILRGTYLETATSAIRVQYQLDPNETHRSGARPPAFRLIARNRSWSAYSTC
ncbi:MAG TPA: hypothetical protein VHX66_01390 [Solirubrobacteraceae bacterium]|jgi:hypothetical protein|nr:hypothetical protein [Solirubrobacteraceae bacterium]